MLTAASAIRGSYFRTGQSAGGVVVPAGRRGGWAIGMLDDGVYGLSFESRLPGRGAEGPERGDGLAILRGGRILGSDRHGGVFTGCYRYDAAAGEAVVEVRLAVPPHGVLLTGLAAGPEGAVLDVAARFPPPRPVSSAVVDIAGTPVKVELSFVGPLARP